MVRVLELTDEGRRAMAAARAEVDEAFHEKALRAAAELLPSRADVYAAARARVAGAHVGPALERDPSNPRLIASARLAQLAIDEGLVALVVAERLHPNHVRELMRPWPAVEPGARGG